MTRENREILLKLFNRHHELGMAEQLDYEKFYLYSIIIHSTAIEGSTVTEVEAQLYITHLQHDIRRHEESMQDEANRKGGQKRWTENPRGHYCAHS